MVTKDCVDLLAWVRRPGAQRWALAAILLLALLLRLGAAWKWNDSRPDGRERLIGDELGYDNLARDLLAGYGFTWPGRVPLYPLWLATVYTWSGGSYDAVSYLQSGFGVAVVLLCYAIGRRLSGRWAGLLAGLLAAVSYVLIHQSVRLMSETLYTPLILLTTLLLVEGLQRRSARWFALAGGCLGLSNLVRPTLFLFPPVVALLLFVLLDRRAALRAAGAFFLASSLVIAPWMVRNYLRYQAIYPLATSNAILWQGSPEYYHYVRDEGHTYMEVWNNVIYGPGGEGHDPGSVEGDRWWTQRALRSIAAEPLVYLRYALEKSVTYWTGDPNADWGDTYVLNYRALYNYGFSRWVVAQYLVARVLLPAAALLAGLFLMRKEKWRVWLPVWAIVGYNVLLHAATHAEARLSEPLQPFLLIVVAAATADLFGISAHRFAAWAENGRRARDCTLTTGGE